MSGVKQGWGTHVHIHKFGHALNVRQSYEWQRSDPVSGRSGDRCDSSQVDDGYSRQPRSVLARRDLGDGGQFIWRGGGLRLI